MNGGEEGEERVGRNLKPTPGPKNMFHLANSMNALLLWKAVGSAACQEPCHTRCDSREERGTVSSNQFLFKQDTLYYYDCRDYFSPFYPAFTSRVLFHSFAAEGSRAPSLGPRSRPFWTFSWTQILLFNLTTIQRPMLLLLLSSESIFLLPKWCLFIEQKKKEENDFKFSPSTRYPQTHTRGFAARLVPICPICWSFCQKASLGKDGRSLPRPAASLIEWLLPQKPNSLTRGGLIEALSVSCPRPLCCSSACLNSIISCRLRIHGIC